MNIAIHCKRKSRNEKGIKSIVKELRIKQHIHLNHKETSNEWVKRIIYCYEK